MLILLKLDVGLGFYYFGDPALVDLVQRCVYRVAYPGLARLTLAVLRQDGDGESARPAYDLEGHQALSAESAKLGDH
jgi:hypothetical protein